MAINRPNQKRPLPRWVAVIVVIVVTVLAQVIFVRAFRQQYSRMLVQHGTSLLKKQDTAKLVEAASKRAVELDAYDGYGWFNYGTAVYLQRRLPEAIKLLNRGMQYLPHYYNALRLLAFSNYNLKDFAKSTQQFREYLSMMPSPEVSPELIYRTAGLSALRVADMADANYWLMRATPLSQDKAAVLRERIMTAVLSNRLGTAEYATKLFRFYAPNEELKPFELVANAMRGKKLGQAIEYLESILPESADDMSVVKALAAAYNTSGKQSQAEALISVAVKERPKDASLRLALGDILYAQKRFPDAFVQYDEHLKLAPESRFRNDIEQKRKKAGL